MMTNPLVSLASRCTQSVTPDVEGLCERIARIEDKEAAVLCSEKQLPTVRAAIEAALPYAAWLGVLEPPTFATRGFTRASTNVLVRTQTPPATFLGDSFDVVLSPLGLLSGASGECYYIAGPSKLLATVSAATAFAASDVHAHILGTHSHHARITMASASALRVAQTLSGHPRLTQVSYPLLRSHPSFEFAATECENGGVCIVVGGAHEIVTALAINQATIVAAGVAMLQVGLQDPEEFTAQILRALQRFEDTA